MPAPNLTGQTADQIRVAAFTKWQGVAGETAAVGTPEFMMLELLSFLSGLNNAAIQQGLEGNLINYSQGARLDGLGILFGVSRLLNETDELYRARILLAPSTYTTAGTEEQIKTLVKNVDPSITDVSVTVTTAPNVTVRILTATGLPSAPLIAKVLAMLQDKKVRPVCVVFTVTAPTVVNYNIAVNITAYADADIATLVSRCCTALNKYIALVQLSMGRDVVVAQIVGALQNVSGVYKAVVTSPAADIIVLPTDWASAPLTTPATVILVSSVVG